MSSRGLPPRQELQIHPTGLLFSPGSNWLSFPRKPDFKSSRTLRMEPLRASPRVTWPERHKEFVGIPPPRAPLLPGSLFCVSVLWFPEQIPVGAGVGETSLGRLVLQRRGGDGFCTSLSPSWGILHLAVRWPHDVLGPLPLRPRWACEGLIPTASDKGNSCKTLICCLQTRLWGMLENLKVNVSLASCIK